MKKMILLMVVLLVLVGCSEKKESKEKEVTKNAVAGQIEVVENKDYKDHKKKELESKGIVTGEKGDSFYYDYDKKDGSKKESQNMDPKKNYTPIDANMRVRSPYDEIEISLLVSKLSKKFIVKCSACHNDYANGIIGPSLLGKDKDFIYNAIMDFKSGKKQNVLMDDLIHLMSNEEIRVLAEEISAFNIKINELRESR